MESGPRLARAPCLALATPRFVQRLVGVSSAILVAVLNFGGTCAVAICSSTCDPCDPHCGCPPDRCHHPPPHASYEDAHRLEHYDYSVELDGAGTMRRVYSHIVGVTLLRASGAGPYDESDVESFARAVVEVNGDLFAGVRATREWSFRGVERVAEHVVVRFERALPRASSLTMLIDGAGNLIRIEHESGTAFAPGSIER